MDQLRPCHAKLRIDVGLRNRREKEAVIAGPNPRGLGMRERSEEKEEK